MKAVSDLSVPPALSLSWAGLVSSPSLEDADPAREGSPQPRASNESGAGLVTWLRQTPERVLPRAPQHPVNLPLQRVSGASLVAQMVKNLPAMQETLIRFLGREDLLEEE